jgi:hypothetical protein
MIMGFTLLFMLMGLTVTVWAQNEESEKNFSKHWQKADSAFKHDYECIFDDFSFNDFPFCKGKKKYNGHWAGFELGMGGYLTKNFDMNFDPAYSYMNMNTARSLMVNFNLYELNVNLWKNHIGFTTGFGFQVNNYFFTGNYVMSGDSSKLVAFKVRDAQGNSVSMETNKLVTSYFNIPLLFEYQTNPYRRSSSFHVSAGIIAGARIGSYTKQAYHEKSGTYYLVDDKGNTVSSYEVYNHKVRSRGPYHLSPFKIDAAFRIGWSHLNLFGTYSLTEMFSPGKGPQVYPFTVGLTLVGW